MFDHAVPALNRQSAELHQKWRTFCKYHDITHLHDIGNHGISHVISVEHGYARPGTLQVSVDTHANTCGAVGCFATALGMDVISDMVLGTNWYCVPRSVLVHISGELPRGVLVRDVAQTIMSDIGEDVASGRAIELVGPFVEQLSISGRMTLCNWTRKVQALTGIVNPDVKTLDYVRPRTTEKLEPLSRDPDAVYETRRHYDVSTFEPVVAAPPDPLNTVPLSSLVGLRIDQGLRRLVRRRKSGRHSHHSGDATRATCPPSGSDDRHAGITGNLVGGCAGGPAVHINRGWRHRDISDLWYLLWRAGSLCGWRGLRFDLDRELSRAHGQLCCAHLSCQPPRCRRSRSRRRVCRCPVTRPGTPVSRQGPRWT